MSDITRARILYRDDCEQRINLVHPIPREHADALSCLILTMRHGDKCTADSVTLYGDDGEELQTLVKRPVRESGDAS